MWIDLHKHILQEFAAFARIGRAFVPAEARHDVARILSALAPPDADLLMRVARGEMFTEIGEETGVSKQSVYNAHARALSRAQRAAAACFRK